MTLCGHLELHQFPSIHVAMSINGEGISFLICFGHQITYHIFAHLICENQIHSRNLEESKKCSSCVSRKKKKKSLLSNDRRIQTSNTSTQEAEYH